MMPVQSNLSKHTVKIVWHRDFVAAVCRRTDVILDSEIFADVDKRFDAFDKLIARVEWLGYRVSNDVPWERYPVANKHKK